MKRILSVFSSAMLAVVALLTPVSVPAQRGQQSKPDAVIDGLKFHSVGAGFVQVFDAATNQNAGTIMFPPNQPPMFALMSGYDEAKIKAAYEKYAKGDTGQTAPAAAAAGTATAPDASTKFDPTTKTATLADGSTVTFVDNENLKVQMPGPAGTAKIYDLHFHGASGRGFARSLAGSAQGRVGSSFGGGGVIISMEGQNGMPGGQVYDTADGVAFANSGMVQAKQITAAVRQASSLVKTSQPDLANSKVVKSLLSNNLGL